MTRVRLTSAHAEIRLEIAERFTTRQRRAVVNSFFRHILPWFKFFEIGSVIHEENTNPSFRREEERLRPWFEGQRVGSPIQEQALGLRIRLKRLEIGLTQFELAQRAGISRWQLVQIESGRAHPRQNTLLKIEAALANPTQPNICRT